MLGRVLGDPPDADGRTFLQAPSASGPLGNAISNPSSLSLSQEGGRIKIGARGSLQQFLHLQNPPTPCSWFQELPGSGVPQWSLWALQ